MADRLQHQAMQIPLHDHVLYTFHRLVEKGGVSGSGVVNIGVLVRISHEIVEFAREELLARFDVVRRSGVLWEMPTNWGIAGEYLFSENVDLVEKEDERRFLEILAVGDALEEHECFSHLILNNC